MATRGVRAFPSPPFPWQASAHRLFHQIRTTPCEADSPKDDAIAPLPTGTPIKSTWRKLRPRIAGELLRKKTCGVCRPRPLAFHRAQRGLGTGDPGWEFQDGGFPLQAALAWLCVEEGFQAPRFFFSRPGPPPLAQTAAALGS